jgi:hypothetical protein
MTCNDYDMAAERYREACRTLAEARVAARKLMDDADAEYADAARALALHEITPGIPLCNVAEQYGPEPFDVAFGKHTAEAIRQLRGRYEA